MSAELATMAATVEKVLIEGNLAQLSPDQRISYYKAVCESVGLNPLTKPFDYLELDSGNGKKLVLYAKRDATDQLRKLHGVSVSITDRQFSHGVYVVTAKAKTADGREDESTGAVPVEKEDGEWKTASSGKRYFAGNGSFAQLRGDSLANALMKAETKAKRRVTLSICGLGLLDESEVETIPNAHPHVEPERPALPANSKVGGQHDAPPSSGPSGAQVMAILSQRLAQCEDEESLKAIIFDCRAARATKQISEDQWQTLVNLKKETDARLAEDIPF